MEFIIIYQIGLPYLSPALIAWTQRFVATFGVRLLDKTKNQFWCILSSPAHFAQVLSSMCHVVCIFCCHLHCFCCFCSTFDFQLRRVAHCFGVCDHGNTLTLQFAASATPGESVVSGESGVVWKKMKNANKLSLTSGNLLPRKSRADHASVFFFANTHLGLLTMKT